MIIVVEIILLALHVFMFSINMCINIWNKECPLTIGKFNGWTNPSVLDFIWYQSEWGYISGMLSLVCLIMTHYSKSWQKPAQILMQISFSFNAFIFTCFVVYIAPERLSKQIGFDYLEMAWVHILPICSSTILIVMLDMVYLKRDAKYTFYVGNAYGLCNFIGTQYKGEPMYKLTMMSWKYPLLTVFIIILMSVIITAASYSMAILTQKIRGFDEEKEKWNFEKLNNNDFELKLYESNPNYML